MIKKLKSFQEECKSNLKNLYDLVKQNKVKLEILKEDEMIKETRKELEESRKRCTELKSLALMG